MSAVVSNPVEPSSESNLPPASRRLVRAAISGLLAFSAYGCDDDDSQSDDEHGHDANASLSDEELKAACADMVEEASKSVDLDKACAERVDDAKKSVDADKVCGDKVKIATSDADMMCTTKVDDLKKQCEPILVSAEDKTTNSEQKEYSFAELTKRCDDMGGYTQIHAACGGENDCKGFSFGDWGPDAAALTEHSCTGANGCLGLTCIVLPKDKGRTGKEIYEGKENYGDSGPNACNHCHAPDHNEELGTFDSTKFLVYQAPEGTRTTANWLDRTAAEQERIVAFGSQGVRPDGIAYRYMGGYKGGLSRAEIERVVKYIRTLTPVMSSIKTKDGDKRTAD